MMMFIVTPMLLGQAASEGAGAAETGGILAGAAGPMATILPQGGEEVSAMFAAAIAAHAAQFLPVAALGAAQREMFAATVGASAGAYGAMDAIGSTLLAL